MSVDNHRCHFGAFACRRFQFLVPEPISLQSERQYTSDLVLYRRFFSLLTLKKGAVLALTTDYRIMAKGNYAIGLNEVEVHRFYLNFFILSYLDFTSQGDFSFLLVFPYNSLFVKSPSLPHDLFIYQDWSSIVDWCHHARCLSSWQSQRRACCVDGTYVAC